MAGVSRVSPVSFLKAKPKMAIFFFETVLNMEPMTRSTNLRAADYDKGNVSPLRTKE